MTNYKDNLPLFFEELKLKEDSILSISDLLAQLKQQIPVNFVCLEIKEKNYQCSTTGWKEPVCERYGFTYENKWIQLDIPHSLLAELGLKVKEDLPPTFYLAPHLLKKEVETTQGGITIKEGEIILLDSNKIIIKDQETQTELSSIKIKELEKTIAKQFEQLQAKDKELTSLKSEKKTLETELNKTRHDLANANSHLSLWTTTFPKENASQVQARIIQWQTNYNNAQISIQSLTQQLATANTNASNWQAQLQAKDQTIQAKVRELATMESKNIDKLPQCDVIYKLKGKSTLCENFDYIRNWSDFSFGYHGSGYNMIKENKYRTMNKYFSLFNYEIYYSKAVLIPGTLTSEESDNTK